MADQPRARVHAMSIFDCPTVYLVAGEGCLSVHVGGEIGGLTINIYGSDPYNRVPEVVAMTQEEFSKHATWAAIRVMHEEAKDEAASVE